MTQSNESANTANIFTPDYANFDAEDVLHAHFTTILEQGLDRAFAEHGYLDGVIEMWENMMFAAEYEYNDIIESYAFVLSRTNEPWIQSALKSAMLKLSNS